MKVAILMGSDSDFPRLEPAIEKLRELGIGFDVRVLSAHRTPSHVIAYVEAAAKNEIGVFLCAAGGAAHLAGVVAAHTDLPVCGIPIDNPPLGGLDALLSTVQMPGGVPVATFGAGVGGPVNAALFAARVLALSDAGLAKKLAEFRANQAKKVLEKDAALQKKLGR